MTGVDSCGLRWLATALAEVMPSPGSMRGPPSTPNFAALPEQAPTPKAEASLRTPKITRSTHEPSPATHRDR